MGIDGEGAVGVFGVLEMFSARIWTFARVTFKRYGLQWRPVLYVCSTLVRENGNLNRIEGATHAFSKQEAVNGTRPPMAPGNRLIIPSQQSEPAQMGAGPGR